MITVITTTVGLFLYATPDHGYCANNSYTLVLGQWLHDEVSRGLIKHLKSGARKTRMSGLFWLSLICFILDAHPLCISLIVSIVFVFVIHIAVLYEAKPLP